MTRWAPAGHGGWGQVSACSRPPARAAPASNPRSCRRASPKHLVHASQLCPITKDDAWERHFRAQVDAWQQQAAATAAAASAAVAAAAGGAGGLGAPAPAAAGRPGSVAGGPGGQAGAAAAAAGAKEGKRQQLALAALERHLAEAQQPPAPAVGLQQALGAASALAAAAAPPPLQAAHGGARKRGAAAGGGPASASALRHGDDAAAAAVSSVGATPRGPVRQLRAAGGTAVALAPDAAVVRLTGAAADAAAREGAPGAHAKGSHSAEATVLPSSLGEAWRAASAALQASQASQFADWHAQRQAAQQHAAGLLAMLAQSQQTAAAGPGPDAGAPPQTARSTASASGTLGGGGGGKAAGAAATGGTGRKPGKGAPL
jgi:hypothetical protein